MICPSCGAENPSGAKFCNSCGAPQAAACPGCGHGNPPASRFCNACGSPLAVAQVPPRLDAAPSPQNRTPRYLADKIPAGRDALEGERKQVTVLFADIVGSTALIEGRDPEEAQRLLDGAVTVMMDAVHRYEGTVSRLMGDGLMALFGAPIAHEDHAVRACYAALAMQAGIARYAEEARQRDGVEVDVRIGLNSGEVVVRVIADDLHLDYTALGQAVHLAARMEQVAAPGSIRLTAETLRLAEGLVEACPLGSTAVKGLSEPVQIAELVGVGAVRSRFQASASRGLTPFTGRQTEMALVREALERAGAGHGQVVALVGEPGVGKSRLVWEVTQEAAGDGWAVLQAGGTSHATAASYLPVVDLLRQFCQIEAQDDADAIASKVGRRLQALDPALRPIMPPLLALLDVPVEDAAWQALDPPGRRRQTLDGVQRLLLRQSREQPLLLVFEDLHWIDEATQALLDGLVESLPAARILLLVNYRPEYTHTWGSRSYYTQLRIDPLGQAGAEALLDALMGDDPSARPLKPLLIRRTEGNPFFLEECVRSLVEMGALVGERGSYALTRDVAAVRVPATVQAILASRIDHLPSVDKRLLQTASVVGKDVSLALLQAVAETPDDELRDALSRLQAAEFLYPVSLFPEPEYTFKHALTHDVAYGTLLQDRRKSVHGQIVEAIERLYPDRLDEHVERLAHHAVQGEAWAQAVTHCRRAGESAIAHSSNREAVAYFDRALMALEHLPECRDTLEQAIDLRLSVRSALHALGEWDRVFGILHEAEALAERIEDRRRLGRATSALINSYWRRGDHRRAVELGTRVLAISEHLDDVGLRVGTNYSLAMTYRELGAYREAVDLLTWNCGVLTGDLVCERFDRAAYPAVSCPAEAALCLSELGEFARGIELGEAALRLGEALGDTYGIILARQHLGHLHVRRGSASAAISILEPGLQLCRSLGVVSLTPGTTAGLGAAYTLVGRLSEGLSLLEEAVSVGPAHGTMTETSGQAAWLGEAYLTAGRRHDAARLARWALDLAVSHDERGHRACALRLIGEIGAGHQTGDGPQPEAEGYYREALVLAEDLEMRPLQARCHLGLGKLYRRVGRPTAARDELSMAIEMFREMGMDFWLMETEAELAEATR